MDKLGEATRPLILVVDNSQAVTGAVNAIRHATNPLREQFSFAYVLPTGSAARPVLEADGYRVYELPFVEISRRKGDLFYYLPMLLLNGWRLQQLARREGAALIHLNDFYNLAGYVARLFSLGKVRVITHVRFFTTKLGAAAGSHLALAKWAICQSYRVRVGGRGALF